MEYLLNENQKRLIQLQILSLGFFEEIQKNISELEKDDSKPKFYTHYTHCKKATFLLTIRSTLVGSAFLIPDFKSRIDLLKFFKDSLEILTPVYQIVKEKANETEYYFYSLCIPYINKSLGACLIDSGAHLISIDECRLKIDVESERSSDEFLWKFNQNWKLNPLNGKFSNSNVLKQLFKYRQSFRPIIRQD
jgi:hypothetical protein